MIVGDKAMPKMTKAPSQGSHRIAFEKPKELAMDINGILGVDN